MERKEKSQQIEECSLPVHCLEAGLDISVRKTCFNSDRNPSAQGMGKRSRNRLSVSQVMACETGETKLHTQDDLEIRRAAWWGNGLHLSPESSSHLCPLLLPNKAAVRQRPASSGYLRAPPSNVTMRRECRLC